MNSYIPFETALIFLPMAYLVSVTLLLADADMAIARFVVFPSQRSPEKRWASLNATQPTNLVTPTATTNLTC